MKHSPTLAGKKAIQSDCGITSIVEKIAHAVNRREITRYVGRKDTDRLRLQMHDHAELSFDGRFEKLPGVTWTDFGQRLMVELKKADEAEAGGNADCCDED